MEATLGSNTYMVDSSIRTDLGTIGKTAEGECVVHAQLHGDIGNVQLTKGTLSEQ